jgi:cell division septal protein FtsQ
VVPQNPAARRAIRAATPREPLLPPGFGIWVLGRLLAAMLLVGAGWLVYDFGSSSRFHVRTVQVRGNVLLSRDEITDLADVVGANIFWVNRAEVAARVHRMATVQQVEVGATLPDTLEIRVVERPPVGFWTSGDQTYLVDGEGVILKAVDAETAQIRACAGQPCDPRVAALPSVTEADAEPLLPGDHVDAAALSTSARLATLLPSVGVQPAGFVWSAQTGIDVATMDGWHARFDESGDVAQQVSELRSIRDQLTRSSTRPALSLIDVRFGDRPYFR